MIDYIKIKRRKILDLREAYRHHKRLAIQNRNNDGKYVFIMLAADYNNMGDIAITIAQREFLRSSLEDYEIVEVPVEDTCKVYLDMKSLINENSIITLIGGGNSGDMYEFIERYRRFVIGHFVHTKIISFPQTIAYQKPLLKNAYFKEFQTICRRHHQLTLTAREKTSYEFYRENFPSNHNIMTPDIVLTLSFPVKFPREGLAVALRNDIEQKISNLEQENLLAVLEKTYSNVKYFDTCLENFDYSSREMQCNDLFDYIAHQKIVVTDRLHGMIFCAITATPCIVFPNANFKVKETYYNWLSEVPYIHFMENIDIKEVQKIIEEELASTQIYESATFKNLYEHLLKKLS